MRENVRPMRSPYCLYMDVSACPPYQILNKFADFYETWYECLRDHPRSVVFSDNSMADAQTCEVEKSQAPGNIYSFLPGFLLL
jgi:hypothetical protein